MNIEEFKLNTSLLKKIVTKYSIKKLSLFGSAARGDINNNSDIDLLVEFKTGQSPSLSGFQAFKRELSELFNGRVIDVVTRSILKNPYRRKSIESDMLVIFDDEC